MAKLFRSHEICAVRKVLPLPFLVAIAMLLTLPASADEMTRQAQEELRRRHIYFNEIDGRNSPDFAAALKRYQERQGFVATGTLNDETLRSLGVSSDAAGPGQGAEESLPDVPVLRSDGAVSENRGPALQLQLPVQMQWAPPPAPAPFASGLKSRAITAAEATDFVQRYLNACESPNVRDELGFYSERVDYFDRGVVDRQYVQNQLATYAQRWPRRSFALAGPVRLENSDGRPTAKFRLHFRVGNMPSDQQAAGKTDEAFGLMRRDDGGLEIVSVREARVRRSGGRHRASVGSAKRTGERDPLVRAISSLVHSATPKSTPPPKPKSRRRSSR
jgi:peptidoglycan hydrolase-like protein with peptidoglycan-binding domain